MGRQVRLVPRGWEHPKDESGRHIPLMQGPYSKRLAEWNEGNRQWEAGFVTDWKGGWKPKDADHEGSYSEWAGDQPKKADYMPEWAPGEATMLVMYEDTSEGTPISPVFETPEELARWLADNGASAFGGETASYEAWLATAKRGWAISAVFDGRSLKSGVEANLDH